METEIVWIALFLFTLSCLASLFFSRDDEFEFFLWGGVCEILGKLNGLKNFKNPWLKGDM